MGWRPCYYAEIPRLSTHMCVCVCTCFDNCECEQECTCVCICICTCPYVRTTMLVEPRHTFPCANVIVCRNLISRYIAYLNDGLCCYCFDNIGHLRFGSVNECPICVDRKRLTVLHCGHEVCAQCFVAWCEKSMQRLCPICRAPNFSTM